MDRLPLTLAAACVRVDHVHVTRIVDAAKRRGPLRAKVGAGLTVEEFRAGVAARRSATAGSPNRARWSASASGSRSTTSGRRSIRSSPIVPGSRRAAWPASGSPPSAFAAAARSSGWIWRCPSARPTRTTPS